MGNAGYFIVAAVVGSNPGHTSCASGGSFLAPVLTSWCYCFLEYMAVLTTDPTTRDQLAYVCPPADQVATAPWRTVMAGLFLPAGSSQPVHSIIINTGHQAITNGNLSPRPLLHLVQDSRPRPNPVCLSLS